VVSRALVAVSQSRGLQRWVSTNRWSRRLVARFVAGEDVDAVVAAAKRLTEEGLVVTIDLLGEHTTTATDAALTRDQYVVLLTRLADAKLSGRCEVSIKLSALGQALPDGDRICLENARAICAAASDTGTTVTVDMEDHTTVDSTLVVVRTLREKYPWVGAVLQSCLRRTEVDLGALAHPGSRVRLVKGAYLEPAQVAHRDKAEVDRAYVRGMRSLFGSGAYPMVATHDPALLDAATTLAHDHGYLPGNYELQMLYGIRPQEQRRQASAGHTVRVYVPFGPDWYPYLMRRLAERPANVVFLLKNLIRS
jgi:proline dehydrogenase